MSFYSSGNWLSSSKFDSRIKSANVKNSERWIGFFLGPGGVMLLAGIFNSYLTVFYQDVMKLGSVWGGMFLLLFPIISKVIDAVTNIVMGQVIEKTKTRQGKARPWLLISAPLVAISAILMVAIPKASTTVQVIWVMFSYNLFFSLAYTIYYMSHNMLVPLSTRNTKQRDGLAMCSNMAFNIIPGMFAAMLVPMLIIPMLGVDQGKWITMVVVFSLIALPCVILEYYFTKERVTEESMSTDAAEEKKGPTLLEQAKACLSDKYWIMIMLIVIFYQLAARLMEVALPFYCNWVLGTYADGTTQTIVSAIGNFPLGIGIVIMWPLVNKFDKRRVTLVGSILAAVAGFTFMINPTNMGWVLIMLMVRAFGSLPITYILMAMLADALDHVEWKAGFRTDGLSMSIYTIIFTVSLGIAQGVFNMGLSATGYVAPESAELAKTMVQAPAVQNFINISYQGVMAVAMVGIAIICLFYKVENESATIQKDLVARHKAEAEARGEVYVSPEEQAAREQEEQDRIAEENRIKELKARCAKKGLNFKEEERKYQEKLAAQKAKEAAKAAKKKR